MIKSATIFALFVFSFCYSLSTVIAQQSKPEIKVQEGHTNEVTATVFSPDGKFVLSGSQDYTLKLWEVSTGKLLRTYIGHFGGIKSVAFSPDGKYILSGSNDNTLKLWEVSTGKIVFSKDKSWGDFVAFSPDGKYAISKSIQFNELPKSISSDHKYDTKHTIMLWNVQSGKEEHAFSWQKEDINCAVFSPNGKYIFSGSWDKIIQLWEVSTGKVIQTIKTKDGVTAVAFSPDGRYTLYKADTTMTLLELITGKEVRVFNGLKFSINPALSFSPDGKFALTEENVNMILWDIAKGKKVRSMGSYLDRIKSFAFSPDGKFAISGGYSDLKLWELASGKEIRTFTGHAETYYKMAYSPNGEYIITSRADKSLRLFKNSTCSEVAELLGHKSAITLVAFTPDSKYILSGSADSILKLWDVASEKEIHTYIGHLTHTVAFSPDGKTVLSAEGENIKLWEIATGREIRSFTGNNGAVISVAFSPDGKFALSSAIYGYPKLWEIATGNVIYSFPYTNQTQVVASVAFSPDGKFALTANGGTNVGWKNDFSIRLWDMHTLKEVKKITGHDAGVNSVSFSNDGKYIISASMDKTLRLWKIPSGKEVRTFVGHSSYVDYVSFSSDSKFALSLSRDNTTRLWNLETSEWVAFLFAKNGIDWIVWTSDGYWDGSSNCGELVTEIIGMNVYNIDQFAVKNNRPDIILQRLESSNKEAITHYNYQYKKRIKRLGLTEAKLNNVYHVPTTKIISNTQSGKYSEINISFIDEKYLLTHYNVYVNDVPLYGSYGKTLSSQNIELSEKIELTNGENKIEVSCMNEKGAESFRALTYATYNEPVKKDIYLLAFGASRYQNPAYNLKYADKDAMDLEKTIQKLKGKGFANVYTKILTNEQVTPEAIKAAKDFVKDAKPDDTFILFIAGHGMHDKEAEATYYYLTYNADVNNLKATATDFETIEDLLQGIPPRNKLFLMDACESGEIDEEEQGQILATATGAGIASRGFKKSAVEPVEIGASTPLSAPSVASGSLSGAEVKRPYLYQKDRYIYNDLVRRSGAIVFSSSKGGELSYERSDIENGLFTESIMKALTTTEADKDGNGVVSIDELRNYVSGEVAKASGDMQHPTVDRDNIYQKFGFTIK